MNCPFYGCAMHTLSMQPLRFVLLATHGNQCALVTDRHSPCLLEIDGQPIEWEACQRIGDMRPETS
jgi:hypothetical protein